MLRILLIIFGFALVIWFISNKILDKHLPLARVMATAIVITTVLVVMSYMFE